MEEAIYVYFTVQCFQETEHKGYIYDVFNFDQDCDEIPLIYDAELERPPL